MKKLEFKSIDFNKAINYDKSEIQFRDPTAHYLSVANAVSVAQAKHDAFMKELLESAVKIGWNSHNWLGEMQGSAGVVVGKVGPTDTHTALLIDVKEIEKKCEHTPIMHGGLIAYKCKHCGVDLQATWTEKK